ncbi:MAG: hypothetical protein V5B31_14535 [Candidatus Accumulibacter propinquus]|jgi:hypothetical protein|uniref:hypothetical protein n=1 Tax=Candidatus Accumulibacter propinquus TaxID=2954380 RepID=UPI002FC2848F
MNVPSPRRLQYGYLLEIPIMLMVGGAVVATLFFHLPPVGQKVLVCGMALPLLCCLYYVIVAPGWMADNDHLKPTLRLLAFVLLTAMIGTGVSIIVLGE